MGRRALHCRDMGSCACLKATAHNTVLSLPSLFGRNKSWRRECTHCRIRSAVPRLQNMPQTMHSCCSQQCRQACSSTNKSSAHPMNACKRVQMAQHAGQVVREVARGFGALVSTGHADGGHAEERIYHSTRRQLCVEEHVDLQATQRDDHLGPYRF